MALGIDPENRMVHLMVRSNGAETTKSFSLSPQVESVIGLVKSMMGVA